MTPELESIVRSMAREECERFFVPALKAANAEIERLRSYQKTDGKRGDSDTVGAALTDAEREAIDAAARIIDSWEDEMDGFPSGAAATLRGLLERTM